MSTSQPTILKVEGMSCHSCVRHVQGALSELEGIERVEVDLSQGEVKVMHDASTAERTMIEALAGAGYPSKIAPPRH